MEAGALKEGPSSPLPGCNGSPGGALASQTQRCKQAQELGPLHAGFVHPSGEVRPKSLCNLAARSSIPTGDLASQTHAPTVGVLQYLVTSIGRHLDKEGGLQVTPRHTLVWGTEVDLGRAWGDPACSMPATASHPKAPALFMPGIGGGHMEAWQTSMRCDKVCNEPVGMFLGTWRAGML